MDGRDRILCSGARVRRVYKSLRQRQYHWLAGNNSALVQSGRSTAPDHSGQAVSCLASTMTIEMFGSISPIRFPLACLSKPGPKNTAYRRRSCHSLWISASNAPIDRSAESSFAKIRMTRLRRRTSWIDRSCALVDFARRRYLAGMKPEKFLQHWTDERMNQQANTLTA